MSLRDYWLACLDAKAAGLPCPENEDIAIAHDLVEGALFKLNHTLKACLAEMKQDISAAKLRQIREGEADGRYTKSQVLLLLDKQRYRCAYARPGSRPPWCKGRISFRSCHRDHIKPLARSGTNWISNIQLTCGPCNQRKHAKDPVAFAQEIGLLL